MGFIDILNMPKISFTCWPFSLCFYEKNSSFQLLCRVNMRDIPLASPIYRTKDQQWIPSFISPIILRLPTILPHPESWNISSFLIQSENTGMRKKEGKDISPLDSDERGCHPFLNYFRLALYSSFSLICKYSPCFSLVLSRFQEWFLDLSQVASFHLHPLFSP